MTASPVAAQIRPVDPDAIDGDLSAPRAAPVTTPSTPTPASPTIAADPVYNAPLSNPGVPGAAPTLPPVAIPTNGSNTFHKDDLIGAAEGVFGKGAQGLAQMIEDVLKKQGEPNGYIVGREGGGAFVVGLRYGSGTLHHKVEGQRPVYWTGPSIGFDAGANAGNAFVLVYNLYDTQDLYKRYGAGEGQAYLVGGFNVSYLRRGNVVLVPVRMGAGLRLGINAGYMKFSDKQKWLPF
ncbi:DUF1134 domain-containing protein [Novosphingobium sp. JCM 18896]|uniref:DUF1134 domain-containing protein n=1 Tax=Novosphingobium sp. JCM 18896 TaxID=2989731 RepID=UPI002222D90B|nr:DUF1134 domain-containing protein [Novosphingobium sp. JCM 18896]MCW1430838.1 DUF1134 domain-containing protein [Novosphingobium sp. JCM 18896]